MRVYWGTPDSVTDTQAVAQVGGTDNAFYQEMSYGQLSMSATATTWLPIARPSNCDDTSALQTSAYNAAVSKGYNPDAYDHDMIYISSSDCTGRGWGQIDGKWTWIQGTMNNYRTSHELGHNLGLRHSHSLDCFGVSIAASCYMSEYGDLFDTMGFPMQGESGAHGNNHFNAYQKNQLGWMTGRLQDVATSGTYLLPIYEAQTAETRAFRISTPTRTYWIENRDASGFDADLPLGATSGALIHTTDSYDGSDLIDMSPVTSTFDDAALPVGQSWSDPEGVFSITVNSDDNAGLSLSLNFTTPPTYALSVSKSGTGAGTVTSSPSGIDCGATCSTNYPSGTSVTLTATPASGSTFSGWSDACTGTSTCTVGMTSSRSVVATFATVPAYALSVSKLGTGTGTVTSSPSGIDCGATCSTDYPSGTSVTLTATPASGSTFSGWSDACTGSTATCTVSMTSSRSVAATFATVPAETTYQETATYLNGWGPKSDASYSGGAYRSTSVTGDSARLKFTGTGVTWVTRRGPASGKATVYIDGVSKGTVDLYAATSGAYSKAFTGLGSASHVIKVVAAGTKNAAATGYNVTIDAFKVGATTIQETATVVTFNRWTGTRSSSASGGAYRSATASTANTSLTFTGTAVGWITAIGPSYGRASVTIDGVARGTFDLYAPAQQWKVAKSFTGLASGSHTIKVWALGTKNTGSTGTKVVLDAFVAK